MKIDVSDILKDVKRFLGYPVITLEVDDETIKDIIIKSIGSLNTFSDEVGMKTVNITKGNSINLQDHSEIYEVLKVMRTDLSAGTNMTFFPSGGYPIGSTVRYMGSGCWYNNIDPGQLMILQKTYEKFMSSVEQSLHFSVANGYVFIPNETGQITLLYKPKWVEGSEVMDIWNDRIINLATARLKKLLGKARSRYKSNKALFELDTNVYEEGVQEEKDLWAELQEGKLSLAEAL